MNFSIEWEWLVGGITFISAVAAFYRLNISPKVRRMVELEKWRDKVDWRLDAAEKNDNKVAEALTNLTLVLGEIKDQNSAEHRTMREFVHEEIRRMEDKASRRSEKIFDQIKEIRDRGIT